jgi:hypothetical protein
MKESCNHSAPDQLPLKIQIFFYPFPSQSHKTTAVDFKNNGWCNGDHDAPGNSGTNDNAENGPGDRPPGIVKKNASSSTSAASADPIQTEAQRPGTAALVSKTTAPATKVVARRVK